jgi:hypothetical protein
MARKRKDATEKVTHCERAGCENTFVSTYKSPDIFPRPVKLCNPCYTEYLYALRFAAMDFQQDRDGFLEAYLGWKIRGIPSDENFRRRFALRNLARSQKKLAEELKSAKQSYSARAGQLIGILPAERIQELGKSIEETFNIRKKAILKEIQELLEQEPLWTHFFAHIFGEPNQTAAYIIGEIGAAQTLYCPRHKNPKPFTSCGCYIRDSQEYEQAIAFSSTLVYASGIEAFPSSSDLLAFFGLGLQPILVENGAGLQPALGPDGQPWRVREGTRKGDDLHINLRRKSVVIADLAGALIRQGEDNPWYQLYKELKQKQLEKWQARFSQNPPPACRMCYLARCPKCERGEFSWEPGDQQKEGYPHWVCTHSDTGHHFGTKKHIDECGKSQLAATILKALYHRWRHLELGEPDIQNPRLRALLPLPGKVSQEPGRKNEPVGISQTAIAPI